MRQRYPFTAIISTFLLLVVLCLNAHAGEGDRAVVRRAPTVYPEIARQMHIVGSVLLTISIAADGSVSNVKVERGHPILIDAAVDAVRKWKWKYVSAPGVTQATVNISFESH